MTRVGMVGRAEGFSSGSSNRTFLQRTVRVWRYRRILDLLVRRDLKVRYAGSALGYLWTVLDPLLMSLVYWYVFTKIFKRDAGPTNRPYMLYLVTGQLIWAWFSGGILTAARAIRSEAQMVRSSNVPRELWVVRVAVSRGVEYMFGLPVIAIYALAYLKQPNWRVVLLPVACLMAFMLVMGVGLILAPLTVLIRDIDRIVPIVVRVLFYASPILYSISHVPKSFRKVYSFNPTVGMLDLARAGFFPDDLNWTYVLHSSIVTVLLFAIGATVFTRLERPVLKEI